MIQNQMLKYHYIKTKRGMQSNKYIFFLIFKIPRNRIHRRTLPFFLSVMKDTTKQNSTKS